MARRRRAVVAAAATQVAAMRSSVIALLLLFAAPSAAAPLTLPEVLASSRFHAPQVLEALARVRGAEGKLLSAQAAFDTVFSAQGDTRLSGYYDGRDIEAKVTQPLGTLGGQAYAGYRVSGGRFPIYEDKRYTNQLGEIKAGAVFSLLRDRMIDDRRFALTLAEGDIALADADRLMVAIGVQTRAIQAYNLWVAAGLRLRVYRDLLELAEGRQKAFRRQVEEGARPTILLTENEQNILRRRTLVVQSEQALAQARQTLSLYLRDADGRPLLVGDDRLPATLAPPLPRAADPRGLVAARPDLRTIDIRMRQAGQRLALDRNAFLPKLDLMVEASQDIGDPGVGGSSRSGTDSRIGFTFTVPLQQRAARGRLAQTNAEIDAFRQRRRFAEEQIIADIESLGIAATQTARLTVLAAEEAQRADAMAVAERRRFGLGASDFFLVNVREEAAADAQVRRLDAAVRQVTAHADLAAATADLDALAL
ncbi:TolC family protein [Sandarakinorhabdus sp. DWP1-3-1]|uniref:TolC family protein n=1 Tax=Sandarakinorhabdus sp. DWP1-3-1 TaxID=2804627 RepID=UPI003CEC2BC9